MDNSENPQLRLVRTENRKICEQKTQETSETEGAQSFKKWPH